MSEVMAQITQIINNSPQVGSLVGGQLAAEEAALRQAQVEESRRQQRDLRAKVLAAEKSAQVGASDPDGRQREETRRERKNRLKAERERRLLAERAARAVRAQRVAESEGAACADSPGETGPVIDLCV